MIDVLTWTYNWQDMFDITLPLWIKQEGVKSRVIAGAGHNIKTPRHPRLKRVGMATKGRCRAYNTLLRHSTAEHILLTQADMQVGPNQLAKMMAKWKPGIMVSERFFAYGQRNDGLFCACLLISREDMSRVKGFDEAYDCPALYAFEDTDLMVRLIKKGMKYRFTEGDNQDGVWHIDHPGVDISSPITQLRLKNAQQYFESKHGIINFRDMAHKASV